MQRAAAAVVVGRMKSFFKNKIKGKRRQGQACLSEQEGANAGRTAERKTAAPQSLSGIRAPALPPKQSQSQSQSQSVSRSQKAGGENDARFDRRGPRQSRDATPTPVVALERSLTDLSRGVQSWSWPRTSSSQSRALLLAYLAVIKGGVNHPTSHAVATVTRLAS